MKIWCVILFLVIGFCVPAGAITRGVPPRLDVKAEQLVGRWQYKDGGSVVELIFDKEGRFSGSITQGGRVVWSFGGKWSLKAGVLVYEYSESSRQMSPEEMHDEDKMLEVTKDYYVIKNRSGQTHKYERVKEEK